jgi:secreted PhoX family phosphatase
MLLRQAAWLPRGALVIVSCAVVGCGDGDGTYEIFFGGGAGSGTNGEAGKNGDGSGPYLKRITFSPIEVASGEARRQVVASESVRIGDLEVPLGGYKLLLRSGDAVGPGVFGRLVDQNLEPIVESDGSERISNYADFSSLLPVGERLFQVTQFEEIPAAMYLTELSQDRETGELQAISTEPIDLSSIHGLWNPCAGSVTPWNTHLGSEEYPVNARESENPSAFTAYQSSEQVMMSYFGLDASSNIEDIRAVFSTYRYGYPVEIAVTEDGGTSATKHYALGRRSLELAYVMPDRKTVYMTDDGSNDGFYMFVADEPGDLESGTLYGLQWNQTSPDGAPNATADVLWIDMGHASSSEIAAALDEGVVFSDLFDAVSLIPAEGCAADFRPVNTETGPECLRLRTGETEADTNRIRMLASRLESRRYAAYVGATTEFRKEEGLAFDPDSRTLFIAFSEQIWGMEARHSQFDAGGPDHVRVPYNYCGAVYALDLAPNRVIGSDYVAQNLRSLIEGVPHYTEVNGAKVSKYAADGPLAGNLCSVNGIANPDNMAFITGYDTLIIGEDSSSGHRNDVVWAYDLLTRKLTRIESAPYGAETTSVYFYPNINGFSYLKSVVQHPYRESDTGEIDNDPAGVGAKRAYDGYIGPLPALD